MKINLRLILKIIMLTRYKKTMNKLIQSYLYKDKAFLNVCTEKQLGDLVRLANQGYYTVANNLPGHGTSVNDCNRCTYTDWISFVEKDIAEMSNECENIYVIGISMGSVLALHLCSVFPIKAAVFAATVIEFKDFIGTNILTPLLHKLIPFHKNPYLF